MGPEAAVSQYIFGAGPGEGAGPGCDQCWTLTDDAGTSITVRVNNLCPADGNPLCAQASRSDTNSRGIAALLVCRSVY